MLLNYLYDNNHTFSSAKYPPNTKKTFSEISETNLTIAKIADLVKSVAIFPFTLIQYIAHSTAQAASNLIGRKIELETSIDKVFYIANSAKNFAKENQTTIFKTVLIGFAITAIGYYTCPKISEWFNPDIIEEIVDEIVDNTTGNTTTPNSFLGIIRSARSSATPSALIGGPYPPSQPKPVFDFTSLVNRSNLSSSTAAEQVIKGENNGIVDTALTFLFLGFSAYVINERFCKKDFSQIVHGSEADSLTYKPDLASGASSGGGNSGSESSEVQDGLGPNLAVEASSDGESSGSESREASAGQVSQDESGRTEASAGQVSKDEPDPNLAPGASFSDSESSGSESSEAPAGQVSKDEPAPNLASGASSSDGESSGSESREASAGQVSQDEPAPNLASGASSSDSESSGSESREAQDGQVSKDEPAPNLASGASSSGESSGSESREAQDGSVSQDESGRTGASDGQASADTGSRTSPLKVVATLSLSKELASQGSAARRLNPNQKGDFTMALPGRVTPESTPASGRVSPADLAIAENDGLREVIIERDNKLSKLERKLNELQPHLATAQESVDDLTKINSDLTEQLSKLKKTQAALELQIERLSETVEAQSKEIRELEASKKSLEAAAAQEKQTNKSRQDSSAKLATMEAEKRRLEKELGSYEDKLKQAKTQLTKRGEEIKEKETYLQEGQIVNDRLVLEKNVLVGHFRQIIEEFKLNFFQDLDVDQVKPEGFTKFISTLMERLKREYPEQRETIDRQKIIIASHEDTIGHQEETIATLQEQLERQQATTRSQESEPEQPSSAEAFFKELQSIDSDAVNKVLEHRDLTTTGVGETELVQLGVEGFSLLISELQSIDSDAVNELLTRYGYNGTEDYESGVDQTSGS